MLDDLEDDHDEQQQEPGRHATDRQAGEHQDGGHDDESDVGDEPGREHEDREWPGDLHAKQGQDDEAQCRVDRRDRRGPANVAARSAHRLFAGAADPVALPATELGEAETPGLVAVEQQVEGQEEPKHHDRPGLGERTDDRRGLLGHPRLDLLDRLRGALRDVGGHARRRELRVQSLDPGVQELGHLDEERDQREGDQQERAADDQDRRRDRCTGRLGRTPSARSQALVERPEGRDGDDREQDGEGDHREVEGEPDDEGPERDRDQHAPADRGQAVQPARDLRGRPRRRLDVRSRVQAPSS